MPSAHTKSIALTGELSAWVDELVDSGEYGNASEVMRAGLRALKDQRERHAAELEEIRARIRRGAEQARSGDFAAGPGEEAVRRAFDEGIKRAGG